MPYWMCKMYFTPLFYLENSFNFIMFNIYFNIKVMTLHPKVILLTMVAWWLCKCVPEDVKSHTAFFRHSFSIFSMLPVFLQGTRNEKSGNNPRKCHHHWDNLLWNPYHVKHTDHQEEEIKVLESPLFCSVLVLVLVPAMPWGHLWDLGLSSSDVRYFINIKTHSNDSSFK